MHGSRKVLTGRLKWLVAQGVLEQRLYSERPPRREHQLTEKGWELADILLAISAWGDRRTAGEAGPPVLRRHRTCGHLTQAELRCAHFGELLHASDVDVEPGPGADHAASSQQGAKIAPDLRLTRRDATPARATRRSRPFVIGLAEHRRAIRLRDHRGMTEDSNSASSRRTWRFAGLYAGRTASGFACGMSA